MNALPASSHPTPVDLRLADSQNLVLALSIDDDFYFLNLFEEIKDYENKLIFSAMADHDEAGRPELFDMGDNEFNLLFGAGTFKIHTDDAVLCQTWLERCGQYFEEMAERENDAGCVTGTYAVPAM